jgi:hypothetical protein
MSASIINLVSFLFLLIGSTYRFNWESPVRTNSHSLRVVIVWRSTILQERTFTQTSTPVITVGESDKNLFGVTAPGLPDTFEMFERSADGYTLRFTDRVDGVFQIGDDEWDLSGLIDQERAWKQDKVRTKEGAANLYEIELTTGDWGRLRLGDVHIFFQLIEQSEVVQGRGFGSIDRPVLAMVALAALLHGAVLLTAFLAFEVAPSLDQMQAQNRFAEVMIDDVVDPPEPQDDEVPSEETSAKKAGGEEGKFGAENSELPDSEVPKNDGEMVDEIDPANTGVNEALSSLAMGEGDLAPLFQDSQGFSNTLDIAMSGDDDSLEMGRGMGGMGLRGTEGGGGGDGFGRIQGLGKVDTGGGPGSGVSTGAKLEEKERRDPPDFGYSAKPPSVGDFCEPADIRRVVGAKANAIKYCFERQLQRQPTLSGKIVAQWKVGLDGKVMNATVVSSTMDSRPVESCIAREISRLRFAQPDGGICVINYPFVFTGAE